MAQAKEKVDALTYADNIFNPPFRRHSLAYNLTEMFASLGEEKKREWSFNHLSMKNGVVTLLDVNTSHLIRLKLPLLEPFKTYLEVSDPDEKEKTQMLFRRSVAPHNFTGAIYASGNKTLMQNGDVLSLSHFVSRECNVVLPLLTLKEHHMIMRGCLDQNQRRGAVTAAFLVRDIFKQEDLLLVIDYPYTSLLEAFLDQDDKEEDQQQEQEPENSAPKTMISSCPHSAPGQVDLGEAAQHMPKRKRCNNHESDGEKGL